jgi:hypothetical protein
MSSTYNAMTNLQEIEMDSLIVNVATIDTALIDNLDCNVGVIDTLTSTTATITSANIPTLTSTTAGITTNNSTNLNTNNLQPITNASSVNVFTNADSTIDIGKYGNTNLITLNQSTLLQTNSNLTLNGTGIIITPNLRVSSLTANKIVLSNVNDNLVSSSYTDTDLAILSANNTFTGNNIFSGTNTFNNTILGNTITGTSVGSAISLYGTTTSTIGLGNLSGGTFTINPNTQMNGNLTLDSGKTLTLNATGGVVNCNSFQGTTASSAISLFTNTTGNSIIIGNTTNGNGIQLQQPVIITGNRDLTLQSGGKINANAYRTLTATSDLTFLDNSTSGTFTIGNTTASNDTGTIVLNRSTTLGASKNLTLQPTGELIVETIRGYAFANTINMYLAQLGAINFGNTSSTNPLTINNNTILASGKTLTLNATGGVINCNSFQGTTASSAILLFTNTTGNAIYIGNTSNGNGIVLQQDVVMQTGKNIIITPTGQLVVETIRGSTFSNPISLYLSQTGAISFGNNLGTGGGITFNDNTILASGKTLTLNNTTASKILLTNGSKNVVSSSYNETDLAILSNNNAFTNAQNSFNKVAINTTSNQPDTDLEIWGTNPKIALYSASAGGVYIDFVRGNRSFGADGSYDFRVQNVSGYFSIINGFNGVNTEVIAMRDDIDIKGNVNISANKTITLNTTGGKVICNVYTGTATSSNLTLGESGNTGNLQIFKTITSSNTYSGANTFSGSTNTFNNTLLCNTFTGLTAAGNISLFSTTTGTLTLGNTAGGSFTINPSVVLPANKTITLNATGGKILCNTLTGTATSSTIEIGESGDTGLIRTRKDLYIGSTATNKGIYCNYFDTLQISDSIIFCASQTIGTISIQPSAVGSFPNIYIGNFTTPAADSSTLFICKSTTLSSNKNLTLQGTGKITTPNILVSGLTASKMVLTDGSDNLVSSIYTDTDFVLKSGSSMSGTLSCNTFQGTTAVSNISLFSSTTSGNIIMGEAQIGGSVYIGNLTPASDTGSLFINKFITLAQNKTLTTGTGGSILCPTYNSTSASQDLLVGNTNTISDIFIGGGLTTGDLVLGSNNVGSTNYSQANLYIQTSAGSDRTLFANTIRATTLFSVVQGASLYSTTLTQDINIGGGLTTGNLFLSNLGATTGYVCINSRYRQSRTISGTTYSSFWNVATGSANNIFQSAPISASAMPAVYAGAPTTSWAVWESNAGGEACFIAQNGDTTVICNPGDNFAIHWQDEDTMGSASGFKFATDGVMSTSSDRRLKRDINPIPVGSDLLDKLSLIQYVNYKKKAPSEDKYFKNGKLRQKYQDIRKGLIAQDVKQIFPEVVEKDGEYHMMKYAEVDIYFNMGVQELIKQNKQRTQENINLQAQIDAQKLQIDDLTSRLIRLEQILLNP